MKLKKTFIVPLCFLVLVPSFVFAQQTVFGFMEMLTNVFGLLVLGGMTAAVAVFLYGIALFIFHTGDAEALKKAKMNLFASVVILFVTLTIWGIIGFMQRTVGNTGGPTIVPITVPNLPK